MADTRLEPAGFGNCQSCPLLHAGSARTCFDCAFLTIEAPAPGVHCATCDLPLNDGGRCRNKICNWTLPERYFTSVWAISTNTGELRRAIHRYKYKDMYGWRLIFGRVLAGHLERNFAEYANFDLILPSPTFTGYGGRPRDHIAEILQVAESESAIEWPVDYNVIRKTKPTPSMVGTDSWNGRQFIARTDLRQALHIPDPTRVAGRRVLIFDDVFTAGHTLVEVARALTLAGAVEVSEVVLARQPWTG